MRHRLDVDDPILRSWLTDGIDVGGAAPLRTVLRSVADETGP